MPSPASMLLAASAFVIFCLGFAHLVLTFKGKKLHPRDAALTLRMQEVSPVITRETSMWKAWVGFNASHAYGAMLFGLVFGRLALTEPAVLFGSAYLQCVGAALLGGYVFLGWRYWFSAPFRGIVLSAVLYAAALAMHWA